MTQIKTCKNTMCEFNFMGECGFDEVSLDESGSCNNCIISDIYTEEAGDIDGETDSDS